MTSKNNKQQTLSLSFSNKPKSPASSEFLPSTTYDLPSTNPGFTIVELLPTSLKLRRTGYHNPGFTIVELLVVIVVIGILAAITIVSYTGISQRAIGASLQSDLTNDGKQLKLYYVDHGAYPTGFDVNNCPTGSDPSPDTRYCLKVSSGATFAYTPAGGGSPQSFTLDVTSTNLTKYRITNDTSPAVVVVATCPTGFIPVPGSATYGTSDFCVMKYIASQVGATTTPISQSGSLPWVNIPQQLAGANNDAMEYSTNVAGCTGCHLITEAEWMTLAQNVLSVPSNWDNGAGVHTVGTGYIYSGHNDNVPVGALAAAADNDPYNGTGQNSPSNQKRTLTLTNGEVIWDLAGNCMEWTAGQTTGGQPGITGEGAFSWKEWTAVNAPGSLGVSATPASTGLPGASGWNSGNGVGKIFSYVNNGSLIGLIRGGNANGVGNAGVLSLYLLGPPAATASYIGFRVSRL